jgi:hypothetical protein
LGRRLGRRLSRLGLRLGLRPRASGLTPLTLTRSILQLMTTTATVSLKSTATASLKATPRPEATAKISSKAMAIVLRMKTLLGRLGESKGGSAEPVMI